MWYKEKNSHVFFQVSEDSEGAREYEVKPYLAIFEDPEDVVCLSRSISPWIGM